VSDPVLYTQVELRFERGSDVRWIPKKFARVGKRLTIDNAGACVVTAVYSTLTSEQLGLVHHEFGRFSCVLDRPRKR
jgi:hypothetical protein